MSRTKWFAVPTAANAIATGIATAKIRTALRFVAWKRTMATSRFQPTCRLGMAAYWFVSDGGCRARYPSEYRVTVSTRLTTESRGGATGTKAKNAKPIRPEMIIASRRRTYLSRRRAYSTAALTRMKGQCP